MRDISSLTGSSVCSLTRVRVYFSRGEGLVKYKRKLNLGLADPALEITPRDARGSKSYWSIVARASHGSTLPGCGMRAKAIQPWKNFVCSWRRLTLVAKSTAHRVGVDGLH